MRQQMTGGGRKAPVGFPSKGGFWRPHTLKHDGKAYGLDIWSAPNAGFWIVCKEKNLTAHRMTYRETWIAFMRELDPEVEVLEVRTV